MATTSEAPQPPSSAAVDNSNKDGSSDNSSDIVTQLQLRLDELATQLYAALRYTSTHHPSTANSALAATVINPPGSQAEPAAAASQIQTQTSASTSFQQAPASPSHTPQPPGTFEADLQELAMDLVAKQVEIEGLITKLPPDLEQARVQQEEKIKELAKNLQLMEGRATEVERRRNLALGRVEGVIGRFGRG